MRYLLSLKYDGTDYHGWQVQPNAVTVQQVIQDALEQMLGTRPNVSGCSRTDSGVHVNKYCCHFDVDKQISPDGMVLGLNQHLPDDIAVFDAREVAPDFHARYSCVGKQYVYRFFNSRYRDPFLEKYTYRVYGNMDVERMNEAANHMVGEHDFSSFCAIGAKEGSHVRTVREARVVREDNEVRFYTTADGFLYNMVRIMAGTLLRVNQGKFTPDDIPKIILAQNRDSAGPTLPAKGLFLNDVYYDKE